MGNGSGCVRRSQSDVSVQMPSLPSTKRSSSSTTFPTRPERPQSTSTIKSEDASGFQVKSNLDQYSTIWDQHVKVKEFLLIFSFHSIALQLTNPFQRILKAEFDREQHHQKETLETKWSKKNTVNRNSAHVESTFTTQSHSCINLSTSEKVDDLIKKLTQIHTQLDETIRRRTEQISVETESVLAQIINESQEEQQRLLQYARKRQAKQDEEYQKRLQEFIAELDATKATEIAHLQAELEESREQILRISQEKIKSVNEQANIAKSKIVRDEQQNASIKIDNINAQLQNFTTDRSFQQFGTESVTRTSIALKSNVGEKALGQNCKFDFVEDVSTENPSTDPSARANYTATTYATL